MKRLGGGAGLACMGLAAVALAACGSSSSSSKSGQSSASSPSTLAVAVSGNGASTKYSVPSSIKGGLVKVSFTNHASSPHSAQLVGLEGGHTPAQAEKIIGAQNPSKTPDWIRGAGGVGTTPPGSTGVAWVVLKPGTYFVTDTGGPSSTGPPAFSQSMTASGGSAGPLPSTPTTIAAVSKGHDHYAWKLSGAPLKVGMNTVTFNSQGQDTIHMVALFRTLKKVSNPQVLKILNSNGPPPSGTVDLKSFYQSSVLDSGHSEAIQIDIPTAGNWVLFCPMTDRDGGKPHFEEGMLTQLTIG